MKCRQNGEYIYTTTCSTDSVIRHAYKMENIYTTASKVPKIWQSRIKEKKKRKKKKRKRKKKKKKNKIKRNQVVHLFAFEVLPKIHGYFSPQLTLFF